MAKLMGYAILYGLYRLLDTVIVLRKF